MLVSLVALGPTGETGIGKTFVIQSVATMVGATMNVLNLNQQSGSSDFMGGFRPLDIQLLARPWGRAGGGCRVTHKKMGYNIWSILGLFIVIMKITQRHPEDHFVHILEF